MDLATLLDWANRFNAPMLAAIGFFVWRLYTNHLPHLEESIRRVEERINHLYEDAQDTHQDMIDRIARLEGKVEKE